MIGPGKQKLDISTDDELTIDREELYLQWRALNDNIEMVVTALHKQNDLLEALVEKQQEGLDRLAWKLESTFATLLNSITQPK